MRRSVTAFSLLLVVLAGVFSGPTAATAADPVTEWGYLQVRDGAKLRYTVTRPGGTDRYPVALIFSVYTDGVGATEFPAAETATLGGALLDAGYAVLGVNMRGTGCSGGQWDLFQPALDGYDVVEWAAAQTWSTGDVGMFGFSAPGISQLLTAATRPPHLRAISPNDVSTDFYRDVANPGGITNVTFTGFWTLAARPASSPQSLVYTTALHGDPDCAATIASRPQPNDGRDFLDFATHPYDNAMWEHYSPERVLGQIDVPILTCHAWQDDQVSSHAADWPNLVDTDRTWVVYTNGSHGTCDDYPSPFETMLVDFFDEFVAGKPSGFSGRPHVQIWHESLRVDEPALNKPAWTTTHETLPVPVTPATFYLSQDSTLDSAPASLPGTDFYTYPLPAPNMESNEYASSNAGWKAPPVRGGSVAFTSGLLEQDMEIFGPGSVDLWFSSTAADTDLQVTLTEIRADGAEQYLQRGWLRASHRALDASRATTLLPYHTHAATDAAPLVPEEPTYLRVELNPIGHVFRTGSRIRLRVEAPTGMTGLFGFDYLKTPATNAVHHGVTTPSKLVLGVVPGGSAAAPQPPCDTVISEPCR